MTDPTAPIEDTSTLIRAYGLLAIGFPLSFAPMAPLSGVGLLITVIGLIYAYVLKRRLSQNGLGRNHIQWILRTVWIASFYWLGGVVLSWALVSSNADNTAIEQMQVALTAGSASPDEITGYIRTFNETNKTLITWSKVVSFGPCLIFYVLRFVKGYRCAEDNKQVDNVKTWGL